MGILEFEPFSLKTLAIILRAPSWPCRSVCLSSLESREGFESTAPWRMASHWVRRIHLGLSSWHCPVLTADYCPEPAQMRSYFHHRVSVSPSALGREELRSSICQTVNSMGLVRGKGCRSQLGSLPTALATTPPHPQVSLPGKQPLCSPGLPKEWPCTTSLSPRPRASLLVFLV